MKVYLNEITGIADAITTLYVTKRSWTRELEEHIRSVCTRVLDSRGALKSTSDLESAGLKEDAETFSHWLEILLKVGWKHITLLRFIDFSVTVEGLHRAGQDDWDAHAKRFNNRIIRSSTRLSQFNYEMSEWYKGKIIPTDTALEQLGVGLPETVLIDGQTFVKAVNGYIREDLVNSNDVKRGLYMLSIPSNFIFKVDLTEWSHVYKLRNGESTANPEVRECCEMIADQLENFHKPFNRELFKKIKN